jgi:glycosyltransferase involved in cell wall biosynthesis
VRIAFYAPLKPPDHPTPSGDREIARLVLKALASGEHNVEVVSRFRTFDRKGDRERQLRLRSIGARLAERVARKLERTLDPQLWLTYHVHHKAPDLLGPAVSAALRIPYGIVEASIAPRQREGPWAVGYADALTSILAADAIVSLNPVDVPELSLARGQDVASDLLPAFIDVEDLVAQRPRRATISSNAGAQLITVAMMRDGAKIASYRVLAAALSRLTDLRWHLRIVGDGPMRDDVETLFEPLRDRVSFLGELHRPAVARELRSSDVFVWPAIDEAFGLAFIEAQACGVPVIGARTPGVASVVATNRTGLLTSVGDASQFADATRRLITDPSLRAGMAAEAERYVRERHDVRSAAARLDAILRRVVHEHADAAHAR